MNLAASVKKKTAWMFWLLPAVFLFLFYFQPLAAILKEVFVQWSASGLFGFNLSRIRRISGFTFYQAFLSTGLTLLVGLPAAWVFSHFKFRGKKLLSILTTVPFILPTVVVAAAFNAMLGPRGWVNLLLMMLFQLESPPVAWGNSLGAIVMAHVFYNVSILIRITGTGWAQLDERYEQAARALSASPFQTWRHVTFPLLLPVILSATLLVFLFDFSSFGVVLLLGGPGQATLETEIYTQAMYFFNLPMAGFLSFIQLLCTLAVTLINHWLNRSKIKISPRTRNEKLRPVRKPSEKILTGLVCLFLIVFLVFPMVSLGLRSVTRLEADRGQRSEVKSGLTLDYYRSLGVNERQSVFYVPPMEAVRNSVIIGLVTMLISMSMGWMAAMALQRPGLAKTLLDLVLMLPMGTSAVTLGLGFLLVFNKLPLDVRSFSFLLPIAHSLVAIPMVVRTLAPALQSIPETLRYAAAGLGASSWRVLWEVDLPVLMKPFLAAAIFSFTISLGEFGATSFLSRPDMPTIPIAIFRFLSQPGASNYGQAMAMSAILMLVCALSVFIMESLDENSLLRN